MTHPLLTAIDFALKLGLVLCVIGVVAFFFDKFKGRSLVLLGLLLGSMGCATNGVDHDQFPDQTQCSQARSQAIQWFRAKYHREPVCPPCIVTHEQRPRSGMAGWTTKGGIHIWVGQLRDETHEWRHWLCIWTLGDMSEEAVR